MKLEQSFEVDAPVERVWEALIDVERVAPNLPGAAITGRNSDGSYDGTFTIKIGPTTAAYTGKLEMQDVDEQAHTATLSAQGSDKRGQGGAKATIISKVADAGNGKALVNVDTDYHITGRLARFGRGGMIEDISEKLLKEFAARLQSALAGPPPAVDGSAAPAPTEAEAPPPTEAEAPPAVEGEGPPPPENAPAPPPPPPPENAPPPPPPPPPPAEPLRADAVVGSVLLERVRRNPWPLVVGVALLFWLIRRRRRAS